MSISRRTGVLAFAVVSLSGMLLTGCVTNNTSDSIPDTPMPESSAPTGSGGGSGGSEQSVAEACDTMQGTISESGAALQDSLAGLADDPTTALQGLESFSADLAQARDEIGNAEVGDAVDNAQIALDEMIEDLRSGIEDPQSFDLNAFVTESAARVQTELAAYNELCGP